MTRIFGTPFAAVYPLYVAKLEKKNRTRAELDQAIEWLTGFDEPTLKRLIDEGAPLQPFFAAAASQVPSGLQATLSTAE